VDSDVWGTESGGVPRVSTLIISIICNLPRWVQILAAFSNGLSRSRLTIGHLGTVTWPQNLMIIQPPSSEWLLVLSCANAWSPRCISIDNVLHTCVVER